MMIFPPKIFFVPFAYIHRSSFFTPNYLAKSTSASRFSFFWLSGTSQSYIAVIRTFQISSQSAYRRCEPAEQKNCEGKKSHNKNFRTHKTSLPTSVRSLRSGSDRYFGLMRFVQVNNNDRRVTARRDEDETADNWTVEKKCVFWSLWKKWKRKHPQCRTLPCRLCETTFSIMWRFLPFTRDVDRDDEFSLSYPNHTLAEHKMRKIRNPKAEKIDFFSPFLLLFLTFLFYFFTSTLSLCTFSDSPMKKILQLLHNSCESTFAHVDFNEWNPSSNGDLRRVMAHPVSELRGH